MPYELTQNVTATLGDETEKSVVIRKMLLRKSHLYPTGLENKLLQES